MNEALFRARLDESGRIIYRNPEDVSKYCTQNYGQDILVSFKPMIKTTEKLAMYAYWESVILPSTVKALQDDGWTEITEAYADKYLKNALAKKVVYNKITGEQDTELPEKKKMSKAKLRELISGAITLLRERHNVECPDSREYLESKKSNFTRSFKKIK